jgi:hypothetical protein
MALNCKWLIVLLVLAAAQGAEKERPKFSPGPIADYPFRQIVDKVTIAAQPYDKDEQSAQAFGKIDPYKRGILPVLVIIQNGTGKTISLDRMKVEVVTPDRERVEATPAADIKYLSGPKRPSMTPGPIPGRTPHISKNKNPLNSWEIEGRSFSARMLPANETASGFFYFQTPHRMGSRLYLSGIRDSQSGNELFYFEIPLDSAAQ